MTAEKNQFRISSFSILVLSVCLTIVGLCFVPLLPVKLNPSRTLPVVSVSFNMNNQSARVVETEVTSKLEGLLSSIRGIQSIESVSRNGNGNITMRFGKYVDIDIVRFEVATLVRQAWKSLPDGVSYPSISLHGVSEGYKSPFMRYTVNAPYTPIAIREYVENSIKPQFAEMKGIDNIEVSGATRMIWKLTYDYEQLKNYNITLNEINSALRLHFHKEYIGTAQISDENRSWIRLAIAADNDKDFDPSKIIVSNKNNTIVYLSQVVEAAFEEEEAVSFFRINGMNSIYISFTAQDGSNRLQLSKNIRQKFIDMQSTLPDGYETHLSYNEGEYLNAELNKIYMRSGLTILILLCFVMLVYRNPKYSLLITLSLIANIAIAVIFYYLVGLEMQLYSLAGLTISLTLIIDNTIVMSDQILRRGNRRAFPAILAATVTTMGSLVVVFFMDESVRLNLQDFASVIIINLTISLFVAVFLVPALIEKLRIPMQSERQRRRRRKPLLPFLQRLRFFRKIRGKRLIVYLNRIYLKVIRAFSRRKALVTVAVILIFGLPVYLLPERLEISEVVSKGYMRNIPDTGFFGKIYNSTLGSPTYKEKVKPIVDAALGGTMRLFAKNVRNGSYSSNERSETSIYVTATLPNGSTKEQMDALIQRMESYIGQFPEVRQFETSINSGRRASINIFFTKEHQKSSFPYRLKSELISKALQLGGGSWGVYGMGDGFSNEVRENAGNQYIKLLGYNYDELNRLAEIARDSLMQNRRIKEVLITAEITWYKDDYTEFVLRFDKERLAKADITPSQLYSSITPIFTRDQFAGQHSGEWGSESVYLTSAQSATLDIWNFDNYPGKTGNKEYKLSEFATIIKQQAPKNIAKEDQQYRLFLQFEYIGSYMQAEKVLQRQIEIFNNTSPLGFKAENTRRNYGWWGRGSTQYWLLFLIIIIVYFSSSILFNSVRQPFTVVFIIPVSFIGIFLTFYLFKLNFDQGGFAAFIMLAGLSVNANIYIMNEYNNIRKNRPGITPVAAYIKAWNVKIRPIFLTIFSTVLGFIPFMYGAFKEAFWFPLAAGTTGGLIFSLLAFYLLLPLFMGVGKREKRK